MKGQLVERAVKLLALLNDLMANYQMLRRRLSPLDGHGDHSFASSFQSIGHRPSARAAAKLCVLHEQCQRWATSPKCRHSSADYAALRLRQNKCSALPKCCRCRVANSKAAESLGHGVICPARDDVLPAFRRRCLFATGGQVQANGTFGRHNRHDSAGMRLVTAASR